MTLDGPDDAALVSLALSGDTAAFGQIMRRHRSDLYRLARRYAGDPDSALDIVQETFVAAWRGLARYEHDRPLGAWLRIIALNKCRDAGRRRLLRRVILGQADIDSHEARSSVDPAADPETAIIARQRLAELDRAIAGLPAGLKEPLILTVFVGLSQDDAGALLGLSAKAVELRVYRARRRLTELLATRGD